MATKPTGTVAVGGEELLVDYLYALGSGEIPSTATTERLAAAFRSVLRGADPARALGIAKQRGRPPAEARKKAIARYMWEQMHFNRGPRGRMKRALDAAEVHFGIRRKRFDRRQLERIWTEHGQDASPFKESFDSAMWEKWLKENPRYGRILAAFTGEEITKQKEKKNSRFGVISMPLTGVTFTGKK